MNNLLDWFNGLRRRLRFAYCYYRARCIVSKARAAAPPEFDPVCIGEAIWTFSGGAEDLLGGIFGTKPEVAPFEDVDFQQEQLDAIMGNIEAWPQIEKLGGLYQKYMLGGYEKALPGFGEILGLGGETTKKMLETSKELLGGDIPEDVRKQVQRSTAYKSLMGGTAGSQMAGALTARDLGRTSLDMITQGANLAGAGGNAAQRWAGIAGGTIMSPAGFVVTPAQQAEMTLTNRLIQQNLAQQRENIAAARNPILGGLSDIVLSLTSAYLGGGMSGVKSTATPNDKAMPGGGGTFGGGGAGSSWGGGGGSNWSLSAAPPTQLAPMNFNPMPSYTGPGSEGYNSFNMNWTPGGNTSLTNPYGSPWLG